MKTLFNVKPDFVEVSPHRILINVGSLMDIPTGKYVRGQKGENLLNGGLGLLTGIAGTGNTFKSTLGHYLILSAASKMAASGMQPYINTYDTEMNIDLTRLNNFAQRFEEFKGVDTHHEGIWSVTDKSLHTGNAWYTILRNFLKGEKVKNRKKYTLETPFVDKDNKPLHTLFPTFGEIDSLSEFETSDIGDIQDKNELGDSGGNTIHMRAGLAKTRLLMELPGLCNTSAHYLLITAHVGRDMNIQVGPLNVPPPKKLQHMKSGEKFKGVTDKFFFLPSAVWQTQGTKLLNNQTTKGPEFPKTREQVDKGSTDLNTLVVKQLRNKSGPSGFNINLVVSQVEGILPTLSEFKFLKDDADRYGIEGSNTNYNMTLYPDVSLSRTTVREKIDNDPKLRRAIKITADMAQIKLFYKELPLTIPTPAELYEKLDKEFGWDLVLSTRDWWTFNNYEHPVPFFSTLDMIEFCNDRKYVPYWWDEKNRKVKGVK